MREGLEADGDTLLTAEEAAHFLGLKSATVRRLGKRGDLPEVRPTHARAVRYRLSDLRALVRRS